VHIAPDLAITGDLPFYLQLCAYVESGFPLFAAMHSRGHAVAVVGYERRATSPSGGSGLRYAWDEVQSLVVIDDNHLPYLNIPKDGGAPYSAKEIDAFIVALPEKVFYPADAVDRLAPTLFKLGAVLDLPKQEESIIRYFITSGSTLRRFVRGHESEFDPRLLQTIMTLPFAQFVWIVEFSTQPQWAAGQIAARAVVDATGSLREVVPLWLFHSRTKAVVFNRENVTLGAAGMAALPLSGMEQTALTRMDQNLRPTHNK
jgi:hypothetical protein